MKILSRPSGRLARASVSVALLALVSLGAVSCGDDSTSPGGAITGVDVVVLPIGSTTTNLRRGITVQLLAAPHNAGGNFVDVPVTWTSSVVTRATVDANGVVTTVGGGDVTITASAGGQSGTFDLNVQYPVGTVTVAPPTGSIRQEGTVALSAALLGTDGVAAVGRSVTWASGNTGIATVNSSGVVSGVADGTVQITATSEGVSGSTDVTISGLPLVATVVVTPGTRFAGVGETVQLAFSSRAASGTVISGTTATWTSSPATVATVSPTGLVTVVGPGSATITATVDNGAGTDVEGTSAFQGATVLVNGVAQAVPSVASEAFIDYAFVSNGTVASFTVNTTASTSGDSDMHIFAPGVTPTFVPASFTYSNYVCRPWDVGSEETCTITAPVAGTYRIRFYNYPGEGALADMSATLTHP